MTNEVILLLVPFVQLLIYLTVQNTVTPKRDTSPGSVVVKPAPFPTIHINASISLNLTVI